MQLLPSAGLARVLAPAALIAVSACTPGAPTRSLEGRLVCVDCETAPDGSVTVDFGLLAIGESSRRELLLRNAGAGPLRIEILPVLAPFAADAPDRVFLQPGGEATLPLLFAPQAEGEARFTVDVGVTSGKALRLRLAGAGGMPRIACEPQVLEFGLAVVDSIVRRTVHCRNLRDDLPAELVARIGDPFRIAEPGVLAPSEERDFLVEYVPQAPGQYRQELTVGGDHVPAQVIDLRGEAIETGLVIDPPPGDDGCYDMGNLLPGSSSRRRLTLSNVGNAAVWLQSLDVGSGPFRMDGVLPAQLAPLSGPGESPASLDLDVFFEPVEVTPRSGAQEIRPDLVYVEAGSWRRQLCFRGRSSGPQMWCQPGSLDFGDQRIGVPASRTFACINEGTLGPQGELLEVGTITVDPPFSVTVSGDFPSLAPDGMFTVAVRYDSAAAGEFASEVVIPTSAGTQSIPVRAATRGASCLALSTAELDFGGVTPACRSPVRTVEIVTRCDFPVEVERLDVAPVDGPIRLAKGPQLPFTVLGGGGLEIGLSYEPSGTGTHSATLTLLGAADPEASTLALTGRSEDVLRRVDVVERLVARADVLVVIDNSGSMDVEEPAVMTTLEAFLDELLASDVDFHLGVTTTGTTSDDPHGVCPGGVHGLENGRLFPADSTSPRMLTSRMEDDDLRAAWRRNVHVGTCRGNEERGLSAAASALTSPLADSFDAPDTDLPLDGNAGFLRTAAALTILFVTDDDDHSPLPAAHYLDELRGVKGAIRSADLLRAYSIDGGVENVCGSDAAGPGTRYQEIVDATSGLRQDICDADHGDLFRAITSGMKAGPRCFALTARPAPPPGGEELPPVQWFQVRVNGIPLAPGSGDARAWYFDATARAICFVGRDGPGAEDRVEIEYDVSCR